MIITIYILTVVLLGVLEVGPSLADACPIGNPHIGL